VSGGQFDWGGRLLKCNGGAQRFSQNGWKSFAECKRIRELDCETDKSSRDERVWDTVGGRAASLGMHVAMSPVSCGTQVRPQASRVGHVAQSSPFYL